MITLVPGRAPGRSAAVARAHWVAMTARRRRMWWTRRAWTATTKWTPPPSGCGRSPKAVAASLSRSQASSSTTRRESRSKFMWATRIAGTVLRNAAEDAHRSSQENSFICVQFILPSEDWTRRIVVLANTPRRASCTHQDRFSPLSLCRHECDLIGAHSQILECEEFPPWESEAASSNRSRARLQCDWFSWVAFAQSDCPKILDHFLECRRIWVLRSLVFSKPGRAPTYVWNVPTASIWKRGCIAKREATISRADEPEGKGLLWSGLVPSLRVFGLQHRAYEMLLLHDNKILYTRCSLPNHITSIHGSKSLCVCGLLEHEFGMCLSVSICVGFLVTLHQNFSFAQTTLFFLIYTSVWIR